MKLTFTLLGILISLSLSGQSFVNSSNHWLIDDCFLSNEPPFETVCNTNCFEFGEPVLIRGLEYRPLLHSEVEIVFDFGQYYRESEGKVYMKHSAEGEEYLIYDFNLNWGDRFEIQGRSFDLEVQVTNVDSVELSSGEKRKRIEVQQTYNGRTTTWIEGIGSELAPMNPVYMFSFDAWVELNCYAQDSIELLALKDCFMPNCDLTTSTSEPLTEPSLNVYPNPVRDQLMISGKGRSSIEQVELIDLQGTILSTYKLHPSDSKELDISHLPNGIYLIRATSKNGKQRLAKLVKQ